MTTLGVGVLGFGTVGAGVVKLIQERAELIRGRTGIDVRLRWVADPDTKRKREVELVDAPHIASAADRLADPDVQVVVELIGGLEPARTLILQAIAAGKHVVTANKALLSRHGAEIFAAARARGVRVSYEASVAGGIPILRSIRDGFTANRVTAVYGIINGTANYILTRMDEEGEEFANVLRDAQRLGYAEADPTYDVDGLDAAHKLVLLVHLALDRWITLDDFYIEGIRSISPIDIHYAREFGLKIKLLAIAKETPRGIEARVHPTMVPSRHLIADVRGNFNAVLVAGDAVGPTLHTGQGAGMMPTASAVLGDILDVVRLAPPTAGSDGVCREQRGTVVPFGDLVVPYYLRFSVLDRPGVLSKISGVLGEHDISIASVMQPERKHGQPVPIVMRTHDARERNVRAAFDAIGKFDFVTEPPHLIRIEMALGAES